MSEQNLQSHVVWFDIPCVLLDRAIAFYEAVLDCQIARESYGDISMGILPHGGPAIGGCLAVMPDAAGSDKGLLVYLNCDGRLDDAVAAVAAQGGEVVQPVHQIGPHGLRAIVRDSEGNRIALHSNA
jgi:predicted enzyme related to lactoylglutathione lyase